MKIARFQTFLYARVFNLKRFLSEAFLLLAIFPSVPLLIRPFGLRRRRRRSYPATEANRGLANIGGLHWALRATKRRTSSHRSGAYKLEPKRGCDSFFSYISCRIINYFHKFPLISFFSDLAFNVLPTNPIYIFIYLILYMTYYISRILHTISCMYI